MDTLHLSYAVLLSSHMTLTCEGSYMKATCTHKTTVLFIATLSPERLLHVLTAGGCCVFVNVSLNPALKHTL